MCFKDGGIVCVFIRKCSLEGRRACLTVISPGWRAFVSVDEVWTRICDMFLFQKKSKKHGYCALNWESSVQVHAGASSHPTDFQHLVGVVRRDDWRPMVVVQVQDQTCEVTEQLNHPVAPVSVFHRCWWTPGSDRKRQGQRHKRLRCLSKVLSGAERGALSNSLFPSLVKEQNKTFL